MARKLDILVPVYNEDWSVIKPLLDSIMVQQNVDFSEVGVIICNDGGKFVFDEEKAKTYPFEIEYYPCEHHGVSATRNACLDHSKAEYVMFCDCDDCMYANIGLFIIFREMTINNGFDTLMSCFVEETRDPKTKEIVYYPHQTDMTFVHGKVHRRKYLINNNIRWNDKLTIHEDSYFNILCQKLIASEDRGRYCPNPFYLWKWRDESVCRHDPLYLNKTFVNMLDSNTELVKQFLDRGREKDAITFATQMIYDSYYSFNCDRWWNDEGKEFLHDTEMRFKTYWKEFKYLYDKVTKEEQMGIVAGLRNRYFQEGLMLERITFDDWIKHIEELK